MLFNIAPQNAEKAKRAFATARPAHVYGYTKSAILTPKNTRMKYCYQIDTMHDIIVCTIRHQEAETVEAVVTARAFTDNSIEIERAELYRNASNYPYRTETNDRYMRKYDQIACIIHGAISAGLLFDVSEKPQETTEATTAQDTTCTDREPQRATEDAQTATEPTMYKYGMRLRGYSIGAQPAGVVERADDPTGQYYDIIAYNAPLSAEDIAHYSLTPLEAPTTITDGTTPASDTRQPDGNTITGGSTPDGGKTITGDTDGGNRITSRNRITPPHHACENAPGRTERAQGEQVPTNANKSPPRGTESTTGRPAKRYFFRLDAQNRIRSTENLCVPHF